MQPGRVNRNEYTKIKIIFWNNLRKDNKQFPSILEKNKSKTSPQKIEVLPI